MCLVRVPSSLQAWVKVVGTAVRPVGFPEGAFVFIRVYNKIAGEFCRNVVLPRRAASHTRP